MPLWNQVDSDSVKLSVLRLRDCDSKRRSRTVDVEDRLGGPIQEIGRLIDPIPAMRGRST
ncbi:MAG: hypothetical protein PF904_11155 [Kiritimatiellae bacterium]|nr:hypothetical protein [Kiritimatiellia bacterium]